MALQFAGGCPHPPAGRSLHMRQQEMQRRGRLSRGARGLWGAAALVSQGGCGLRAPSTHTVQLGTNQLLAKAPRHCCASQNPA